VILWQSHIILSCTLSYNCKSNKKRKEKKRKRKINNDLAVLPSHDNVPPLRYGLRRLTYETRVPHKEGNIYEKDCYPIDVLRCPEWQQHPGEADSDMMCRMLENACRHIQVQPETIPIGEVYYSYSQ